MKNCTANGVRLYSDGLNFACTQSNDPSQLWIGHTYPQYGGASAVTYEGTNTATDTFVVYPVFFHYANDVVKEYVQVNVPLTGTWFADEEYTQPVTQIVASLDESSDIYPYGNQNLVNDESYTTQNAALVANPLTHAAIDLYTTEGKASLPRLEKTIVDGDTEKHTTVAAGETVNFKLTSNVPKNLMDYLEADTPDEPGIATYAFNSESNSGTYKFAFHDVLDKGLTLNGDSIAVTVNGKPVTVTPVIGTDENGNTTIYVELELVSLYKAEYFTKDEFGTAPIVLTYSATANEDIKAGTYKNTAWVEYEGGDTEKDIVTFDTYSITIFKYDQDTDEGLEGAVFKLKDSEGNVIATLTSDENGYVTYEGLKTGTYELIETKAPDGYVKNDKALTIVVSDQAGANNIVNVQFANSLIPHTGGSGTMMYTLIGAGILVVAGMVFVLSRKKKGTANN